MIIRFGFQKHQQSATDFIAELQEVFCKQVLGSLDCPSQWKIHYTKESDGSIQIEPIQERNTVVHGMLNSIEKVIYGATLDNERGFYDKMTFACSRYTEAMEILTMHRALADEEIEDFQSLIDDFFETWIKLFVAGKH
jgi:hypothetical protein